MPPPSFTFVFASRCGSDNAFATADSGDVFSVRFRQALVDHAEQCRRPEVFAQTARRAEMRIAADNQDTPRITASSPRAFQPSAFKALIFVANQCTAYFGRKTRRASALYRVLEPMREVQIARMQRKINIPAAGR
jgi:hypothetical protein